MTASLSIGRLCEVIAQFLGIGEAGAVVFWMYVAKKGRVRLLFATWVVGFHSDIDSHELCLEIWRRPAMKRFILLCLIVGAALSASGCNSCRRPILGWFNRGDNCNPCMDGHTTMLAPSDVPYTLPGPTNVTPTN